MHGYYVCPCKEETISPYSYEFIVCNRCHQSIPLTKMITSSEANAIRRLWEDEREES